MFTPESPDEQPTDESAAAIEKRSAPRFPCNLRPTWRVLGRAWGESRLASVYNISATGIGLLCKVWIKPGTVLILTLQDANQQPSRPMAVRVMHATEQADGLWLVGGAFIRRLSSQELEALVQGEC